MSRRVTRLVLQDGLADLLLAVFMLVKAASFHYPWLERLDALLLLVLLPKLWGALRNCFIRPRIGFGTLGASRVRVLLLLGLAEVALAIVHGDILPGFRAPALELHLPGLGLAAVMAAAGAALSLPRFLGYGLVLGVLTFVTAPEHRSDLPLAGVALVMLFQGLRLLSGFLSTHLPRTGPVEPDPLAGMGPGLPDPNPDLALSQDGKTLIQALESTTYCDHEFLALVTGLGSDRVLRCLGDLARSGGIRIHHPPSGAQGRSAVSLDFAQHGSRKSS
jgi:hypothetical protein